MIKTTNDATDRTKEIEISEEPGVRHGIVLDNQTFWF